MNRIKNELPSKEWDKPKACAIPFYSSVNNK